jgi:hypothetical protein
MTSSTYQIWNGEYWTFEQIVENLSKLVRLIVARTTPEECIDDCMQDAWLRLYERLEADPAALGPDPKSKSPRHTRSYYANLVVWDAHKGSGFGPATQTYRSRHTMPVPIPPIERQREIVLALKEQQSGIDQLRIVLDTQLDAIQQLPAALLRQAFNGEL